MKIMVCFDDSAASVDAVRVAQKFADKMDAKIDIISVINRLEPIKHEQLKEMEVRINKKIHALFKDVAITYTVKLYVDNLSPGEKIVQIAQKKNVDLITIGIQKQSKVGKLLFGSTAQYVILHSPCPVLTVNKK